MEVDYQTKDGTATEGTDYTRANRGTLIFEAGDNTEDHRGADKPG